MNDHDIFSFNKLQLESVVGIEELPGFSDELKAIEAESIGWIPLESGAYLHLGEKVESLEGMVVEVVGSITSDMVSLNVLLLT